MGGGRVLDEEKKLRNVVKMQCRGRGYDDKGVHGVVVVGKGGDESKRNVPCRLWGVDPPREDHRIEMTLYGCYYLWEETR